MQQRQLTRAPVHSVSTMFRTQLKKTKEELAGQPEALRRAEVDTRFQAELFELGLMLDPHNS